METIEIQEVLIDLGYKLSPDKDGWRCSPIYRESHNSTSLKINRDGSFIDFSAGIRGSFLDLIKLSTGSASITDAEEWLKNKGKTYVIKKDKAPRLNMTKTFPPEILLNLVSDHSYWVGRGIEEDIIKQFNGGVARQGRLKGRYVFPIWDSKKELIGFAGRDLYNNDASRPKWKLVGGKSEWKFPLFLNFSLLKEKREIILLESIGDCLALWNAGIKNSIVLFGVEMSLSVLNILLKLEVNRILIALNNDGKAGNIASDKLENRLLKYFNRSQIKMALPNKKDFGIMNSDEIQEWYKINSQRENSGVNI